uniref:Sperm associated antigen 16 n=1 Tax=Gorilla gorilla gorilla TaxID=9595 RepID=A0A2I2Z048_GORGO
MAAQRGMPSSAVRVLEEALGMGLTAAGDARDTADAVAAEGAYYLEPYLYPVPLLLNGNQASCNFCLH